MMFPLRAGRSLYPRCPQLVAVETIEIGIIASTPGTSGPSQVGRG